MSVETNVTEIVGISGSHKLENIRHLSIWNKKMLLTGPKTSMNYRIREASITNIQEFLNAVENKKKWIVNQINQTDNVNFKEPRDVFPSERTVAGEKLEELRVLWRKYFNSFIVKDN